MAISDALPLQATRRDASANLKCVRARDTSDSILMPAFTFTMWRHVIWLASKLGLAPFANHVRCLATKHAECGIYGACIKAPVPL